MARYRLRDRRVARGVMDQAGAFLVAGRLLVCEADLLTYEELLRAERRAVSARAPDPTAPPRGRRSRRPLHQTPLLPGWWRRG